VPLVRKGLLARKATPVPPDRKGLREPWVRRDLKGRPEPLERKDLLVQKATSVWPDRKGL